MLVFYLNVRMLLIFAPSCPPCFHHTTSQFSPYYMNITAGHRTPYVRFPVCHTTGVPCFPLRTTSCLPFVQRIEHVKLTAILMQHNQYRNHKTQFLILKSASVWKTGIWEWSLQTCHSMLTVLNSIFTHVLVCLISSITFRNKLFSYTILAYLCMDNCASLLAIISAFAADSFRVGSRPWT